MTYRHVGQRVNLDAIRVSFSTVSCLTPDYIEANSIRRISRSITCEFYTDFVMSDVLRNGQVKCGRNSRISFVLVKPNGHGGLLET